MERAERTACVNVSAEDCVITREHGRQVIRYLGEEYSIVGMYFIRGRRERELHYILVQHPVDAQQRTN
jgi:hypothetical protein